MYITLYYYGGNVYFIIQSFISFKVRNPIMLKVVVAPLSLFTTRSSVSVNHYICPIDSMTFVGIDRFP